MCNTRETTQEDLKGAIEKLPVYSQHDDIAAVVGPMRSDVQNTRIRTTVVLRRHPNPDEAYDVLSKLFFNMMLRDGILGPGTHQTAAASYRPGVSEPTETSSAIIQAETGGYIR